MTKPSYRSALRMLESKQRTNSYLHDENERLRAKIERLENELATLRATAPYRVEQQHQATVEQGEWRVVKLECPE